MEFEAVIGLEIHVELNCVSKMFCDCPNNPGDTPNKNTCPTCLWLPGAVPRFSEDVLEHAALTCLALNCELQETSAFDQKVYYYPDLPKGFQLSQHHKALARHGWLDIISEEGKPKRLRIRHIHMEEDVAKLVHETEGRKKISLVDFNRAGSPLVEIVTQPDMRSSYDAMAFLRALRTQIRYAGTAECSMESGTMRCDANISLRRPGTDEMNTKVEVKNMNSIKAVGSAIDYEIKRQAERINSGQEIILHTRLWDPEKNITTFMRGKFAGPCVPDPSVPAIVLSEEWIADMKAKLPEMPGMRRSRFVSEYNLTEEEAAVMSAEIEIADYFEKLVKEGVEPRMAAQWISARLLPALKDRNQTASETPVTPKRLAVLLSMLEKEEINKKAARDLLLELFESDESPREIVKEKGLTQIGDEDALEGIIDKILEANPDAVENFRQGKTQAMGFLIGQVMRESRGRANPKIVRDLLEKKLPSDA